MPDLGLGSIELVLDANPGPSVALGPLAAPDLIFTPQTGPAGPSGESHLPEVIDCGSPFTNGA